MICPQCLETIDDDAQECPHCHARVEPERSPAHYIFCDGCGARLSPQDRTCPKCGRPAPGILSTDTSASDLAAGKTASFPRLTQAAIETELPSVETRSAQSVLNDSLDPSRTSVLSRDAFDAREANEDGDPYHTRKRPIKGILITLLIIAVIVGGIAFVALDPLGVMPGVYEWVRTSAQETFPSREGMGDTQDDDSDDQAGAASDDAAEDEEADQPIADEVLSESAAYQQIRAAYDQVVSINDDGRFSDVVDSFNSYYLASSLSTREDSSEGAYELRDELQEIIDGLDEMTIASDSVYTEDLEHVRQLAEWMYERVDVICDSWDISLSYPDGESLSSHQDEILAPMRSAGSSAMDSYYEYVAQWEPVER